MSDWPPGCTRQWVREPGSKKTRYMRRPSSPPCSSRESSQTLPLKWSEPNADVTLLVGCTSTAASCLCSSVEAGSEPLRCCQQFLFLVRLGDRPVLELPGGLQESSLQLQSRCQGQ